MKKVRFAENHITDKIEVVFTISKVYKEKIAYKYGMSEKMYYVWSKEYNRMTWIWANHCEAVWKEPRGSFLLKRN